MKILILGGLGFVGRHFAKRFLDDDHEVTIVDNQSSGVPREDWLFQPRSINKLKLLLTDCRTFFWTATRGPYAPDKYDLIVHCAAVVGGRTKIEEDPLAVATDLSIDAEFFNWAVRATPKKPKVIYFSSSAVYPVELQTERMHCALHESLQGFTTTRIGMPDQTYGFTKLAGEYLAQFANRQYDLDVKIYRPFGGYGEDQSFDYPFPSIIKRVVDGEDPVIVWGSGDQQRDFIHIDDIVEAVIQTMAKLPACEPLNLGTGLATSFFELAEMTCEVLGKKLSVRNNPNKPEGVFSRVADPYKMLRFYKPKIGLTEGVARVAKAMPVKGGVDKPPSPM